MKLNQKALVRITLGVVVVLAGVITYESVRPRVGAAPDGSMWPLYSVKNPFMTPDAAAYSLATDFVGMSNIVIDSSRATSDNTWNVVLQSGSGGAPTTVSLAKRAVDNSWWVTAASARDVTISSPGWNAKVSGPVRVSGQSSAFEAVVNGVVFDRETGKVLRSFTAMGGSNGIIGTYSTTVSVFSTSSHAAAIMMSIRSAKDGKIVEFSLCPFTRA